MTITIMVVEDHQITRTGLKLTLQQYEGFQVVADVAEGKTAVSKALELHPDIVLMDIGLPELNGIDAAREIKSKLPEIRVIMLTSHDEDEDVFSALAAGADGYCLKDIAAENLAIAVQSVHSGAVWLDPSIARRVIQASLESQSPRNRDVTIPLSERELEVLALVVEGLTNQEIAGRLIVSADTVKSHMRHIMEKLAVSDRTQAAVKALRQGLI